MNLVQPDPNLDMPEGKRAHGSCDVNNPTALNQRITNSTVLPRPSRDEREQVQRYVLERLPTEAPILPKEGGETVIRHQISVDASNSCRSSLENYLSSP
jgi:hypothetical protein